MKKFPYIPDQTVLELDGVNAKNDRGEEVTWTHFSWLCGRISDQAFQGSKAGLEGLAFALATQTALSEQKEEANNRGFWLLEDEPANALIRATKTPQSPYNPRFALTHMVFASAFDKVEDVKPGVPALEKAS